MLRDSKNARRAAGLVRLDLWLDKATFAKLIKLSRQRSESKAETIRAALRRFFSFTLKAKKSTKKP